MRTALRQILSPTLPNLGGGCKLKSMSVTTQKHSGFTIVELLIVIVIIAILAAITIVAYNGIQARARASAASSALTQAKRKLELYKVDNTIYPTSGNLANAGITDSPNVSYQYTSATGASYCLTAINGNTAYYIDSATQPTPTQGGCNGQIWPGGVAMTNLVSNGDFSQGTTGWNGSANYSRSAAGQIMTMTVVTVPVSNHMDNPSAVAVAGHKYYIAYEINPFRTHTPTAYIGGAANNLSVSAAAGVFTRGSTIIAAANTNHLHIYANGWVPDGAVVGAQAKFKNVFATDLTATFGAGAEPTKAQMDAIMQRYPNSWFSGTVTANTTGIL